MQLIAYSDKKCDGVDILANVKRENHQRIFNNILIIVILRENQDAVSKARIETLQTSVCTLEYDWTCKPFLYNLRCN